jgi:hypothetical protein
MDTQNIFSDEILNVLKEAGDLRVDINIGFREFVLVW